MKVSGVEKLTSYALATEGQIIVGDEVTSLTSEKGARQISWVLPSVAFMQRTVLSGALRKTQRLLTSSPTRLRACRLLGRQGGGNFQFEIDGLFVIGSDSDLLRFGASL